MAFFNSVYRSMILYKNQFSTLKQSPYDIKTHFCLERHTPILYYNLPKI